VQCDIGGVGGHAEHVGQFLAIDAVAQVQVQDVSVAVFETVGGGTHQSLGVERRIGRRHLERLFDFVTNLDPLSATQHGEASAAGDGVEPGPQLVGVAQLTEPLSADQERVLGDVSGIGIVAHN